MSLALCQCHPVRAHTSVLPAGCSRCHSKGMAYSVCFRVASPGLSSNSTNLIVLLAFMKVCQAFRAGAVHVQVTQECFFIWLRASHTLIFPNSSSCTVKLYHPVFQFKAFSCNWVRRHCGRHCGMANSYLQWYFPGGPDFKRQIFNGPLQYRVLLGWHELNKCRDWKHKLNCKH